MSFSPTLRADDVDVALAVGPRSILSDELRTSRDAWQTRCFSDRLEKRVMPS